MEGAAGGNLNEKKEKRTLKDYELYQPRTFNFNFFIGIFDGAPGAAVSHWQLRHLDSTICAHDL
jgi:hypothetical protein